MRPFNPLYDQIRDVPNGSLNISLIQIELSRPDHSITGSGYLTLKDGNYVLTVLNATPPTKEQQGINVLMSSFNNDDDFQLRSAHEYCYHLSALDEFGNKYDCKYVDAGDVADRIIYSCSLRSALIIRSENFREADARQSTIVFKGNYSFATNISDYQNTKLPTLLEDGGSWKHLWQIHTNELQIKLFKDTKFLQLDIIAGENSLTEEIAGKIIETLDFVMGLCHKYYYQLFMGADFSLKIALPSNFKQAAPSAFTAPYQRNGSNGDEAEVNARLFECYYNYIIRKPDNILTKIHKRIVDSGSGYYYRHGLVISIAIEKILTRYFPKDKQSLTADMKSDIQLLEDFLVNLKDSGIISRTKTFIENLKDVNKYIPGKMIEKLEKDHIIGPGSLKAWKKLRNQYAHGDDFNDRLPMAVALVQRNITLYYELLFRHIGYNGRYSAYTEENIHIYRHYPLPGSPVEDE